MPNIATVDLDAPDTWPVELRRELTAPARRALLAKFATDEERSAYFSAMARRRWAARSAPSRP